MTTQSTENFHPTCDHAIQGQLLRQSERREVAIFLREGSLWVADFIDGNGLLVDAATWFRFNCGTPSNSCTWSRVLRESAVPLSEELATRIDGLQFAPRSESTTLPA